MTRYVVKFLKDVMGENGVGAEVCQDVVELEAESVDHAEECAKRTFCENRSLTRWSVHADRILVAEAEFPS